MALDPQCLGRTSGPQRVDWTARDVILYALGVGAGQSDAGRELHLTTENTAGSRLEVLPGFALALVQRARVRPDIGPVDAADLVHAGQTIQLFHALPVEGAAMVDSRISAVEAKRSGWLVHVESRLHDADTQALLARSTSTLFIRRPLGTADAPASARAAAREPRPPATVVLEIPTRSDQALLFRLSGDTNPLHSDPAIAARAGHGRPILHGLCSLGIAVRGLLAATGHTPGEVLAVEARFTGVMWPGEVLRVSAWPAPDGLGFACDAAGRLAPVIEYGLLRMR